MCNVQLIHLQTDSLQPKGKWLKFYHSFFQSPSFFTNYSAFFSSMCPEYMFLWVLYISWSVSPRFPHYHIRSEVFCPHCDQLTNPSLIRVLLLPLQCWYSDDVWDTFLINCRRWCMKLWKVSKFTLLIYQASFLWQVEKWRKMLPNCGKDLIHLTFLCGSVIVVCLFCTGCHDLSYLWGRGPQDICTVKTKGLILS